MSVTQESPSKMPMASAQAASAVCTGHLILPNRNASAIQTTSPMLRMATSAKLALRLFLVARNATQSILPVARSTSLSDLMPTCLLLPLPSTSSAQLSMRMMRLWLRFKTRILIRSLVEDRLKLFLALRLRGAKT